jgi:hypothetical protein
LDQQLHCWIVTNADISSTLPCGKDRDTCHMQVDDIRAIHGGSQDGVTWRGSTELK